jgi:serine/threonine protein phosphatase PrpC
MNAAFAVFDGHGGNQAADYCQANMGEMLERQLSFQSNVLQGVKKGKSAKIRNCNCSLFNTG